MPAPGPDAARDGRGHRPASDGTAVRWRFTTTAEGDLAIGTDPVVLAARRQAVAPGRWVWLHQVHGAEVVTVTAANAATVTGSDADALVSTEPGLVLAVQTADCVPVVLLAVGPPEAPVASGSGVASGTGTTTAAATGPVVAVAHAGWRGTEAGVIEATVARMRALGAGSIEAIIGPCIRAECYEFGAADLARLVARFGPQVRTTTDRGTPALDVARCVQDVLDRLGVPWSDLEACTACTPGTWFSHRARGEVQRQAAVVWIAPRDPAPEAGGALGEVRTEPAR